jgi:transposase
MTRPYSVDLRERVVRAVESGVSCRATAAKFEVSVSFVVKLMQRWRSPENLAVLRAALQDRRRAHLRRKNRR